eukprot:CAMPEP_0114594898 /NCGR_PEP_ID=MMETSP0125-20121206/16604_1 /TAXON_ID=485358 ORGANISM="Aristerostoma sp., Strain ATCC 50986" /NCGR_SAMPLE_ID=MMETSP0125 /ASSEMBLY_ACC=CAM_ASM_000245 /LENGTH=210 /DNA_ID=CAMNT_0001795761 /DNA_START=72 /DNA_END=704 /DNA_ORIENTATION=-
MGLIIGSFLHEISKTKLKLPVMPSLLVIGILFGAFWEDLGIIGSSANVVSGLTPRLIPLVFIPILALEASFSADFYVFRRALYQIMVLAIPGVIIQFLFYGIILKLILQFSDDDLEWKSALCLGALMSCTKPESIIKVLKEIGAPNYLTLIMSTEALFTFTSSLICFFTLLSSAKDDAYTVGDGVEEALVRIFGGFAVGLGLALILSWWH